MSITSTKYITVQVASINDYSSDVYMALPTDSLSTNYSVISYVYKGHSLVDQGPSQARHTHIILFDPESI